MNSTNTSIFPRTYSDFHTQLFRHPSFTSAATRQFRRSARSLSSSIFFRVRLSFRQLADALPQIVWTARPDGFLDYYNERWYEFTGFTRRRVRRPSWKPILHPDDVQRCVETYYGCLRSGPLPDRISFQGPSDGRLSLVPRPGRAGARRTGTDHPLVRHLTDIDDRKQAEETTRFLADASAALAELTDYQSTLQKVAGLAVPFFADWCAVDMQEADGSVRRLAVTHGDPAKVQLAHELFRRYPPQPSDPHGVMKVMRTGEPEWMAMIPDSLLVERPGTRSTCESSGGWG